MLHFIQLGSHRSESENVLHFVRRLQNESTAVQPSSVAQGGSLQTYILKVLSSYLGQENKYSLFLFAATASLRYRKVIDAEHLLKFNAKERSNFVFRGQLSFHCSTIIT
jgi:hypothetical protein